MNVLIVVACLASLFMVVNGQGASASAPGQSNRGSSGRGNTNDMMNMMSMYGRGRGAMMSGGAGGGLAALMGGGSGSSGGMGAGMGSMGGLGSMGGMGGAMLFGMNMQDMIMMRMCSGIQIPLLRFRCIDNIIN